MEQQDREPDFAVHAAAEWLANGRDQTGRAIVPEMKTRFGITAVQCCEALRIANALRLARAH